MSLQTMNMHFNLQGLLSMLFNLLILTSHAIESVMFHLIQWYELYMYTPLQSYLSPFIARIPRSIRMGDKDVLVFNANIVTYSRTLLIIPIAWSLKWNYPVLACSFVLLHNFLDHVDGIVAKVQKGLYGEEIDDPLLGGFMDAFCDKIVNVFCLWTIVQETHFGQTSLSMSMAFVLLCYTITALEAALAVVRVQDYFQALYSKNKTSSQALTAATMEGKLKEKLESMGLAFLCLSTGYLAPFHHWSGVTGILCFVLTIRLAYASLMEKLQVRQTKKTVTIELPSETVSAVVQKTIAVVQTSSPSNESTETRSRAMTSDSSKRQAKRSTTRSSGSSSSSNGSTSSFAKDASNSLINKTDDQNDSTYSSDESQDESSAYNYHRSASLPAVWIDGRADKVYTVGCFDLFHEGHRLLLQRMRQFGRKVIVGVHDSRSIHKLKNRVPVDGTETRMLNVKRYADQVYCISGTDPSNFVSCIVHLREDETGVYVRGDDMADFPSRRVVEALMPVKFLPYTNGVSSTQLRKELYSHIQADDMEHLEKIN